MSLTIPKHALTTDRFPRSRGDEPSPVARQFFTVKFSPLTRG